jgi:hypothetical protein
MGVLSRLLGGSEVQGLAADLITDYRAAAEQAALLRAHAERARYPQVAAQLRQLAEVEERHAAGLRERVLARGEAAPEVEPPHPVGRNQWERAVDVLHRARRKRMRLIEHIGRWDPEEPHVVEFLRQVEQEAQGAFPVYEGLVMRSDPQAID